jgi:hypothetical protein
MSKTIVNAIRIKTYDLLLTFPLCDERGFSN